MSGLRDEPSPFETLSEQLAGRPSLVAFGALVIGLSTAFSVVNVVYAVLLAALVFRRLKSLVLLLVPLLVGLLLRPLPVQPVTEKGQTLRGIVEVVGVPNVTPKGQTMPVLFEGKRYRLFVKGESDATMGDRLAVEGDIEPFRDVGSSPRYEAGMVFPDSPPTLISRGFFFWRLGGEVRASFLHFLDQFSDVRTQPTIAALCFNVTAGLSDGDWDLLRRSGTIHIVSTSGLHVVIVAAALALALAKTSVPRWAQLLILLALLLLYSAAAGFRPPMLRSVVMVLVWLAAYFFRRSPDGLSALSFAGIVQLLIWPPSVADIGFQLSFATVGSLVLFGPRWQSRPGASVVKRALFAARDLVWVSTVASLTALPLLLYHFHEASLVAPLGNILVVPFVAPVVIGSLIAWMLSAVAPVALFIMKVLVDPLAAWIGVAVGTVGSLPFGYFASGPVSPIWSVMMGLGLLLAWRPRFRPADDVEGVVPTGVVVS
ncbi:MAG: ComEC/Rec2 family competence protein [Fimbriimonadaceae bacterium]|nr:ComEC/Rec2 family competence protein [Fimbriimonadaceae bacterium]QYK56327.1 MAG: ComEC/Rec2 family competence protein [Fimbriimonadaceae bacterium]